MGELVSDCPQCAALAEAARNAEAANAILLADRDKQADELHERIDALTASLATAHRQTTAYKAQLSQLHKADPKADTILGCLAVWEQCCWAGKRRPSLGLDDKRAALVRRALKLPRIGEQDICDAFRGLGLLPYVGEHGRTGVYAPGVRRFAEVEHALRDAPTLERFRDYYRRTQATCAERLLELWEAQCKAEGLLMDLVLKARGEQPARLDPQAANAANARGHLFVIDGERKEAA